MKDAKPEETSAVAKPIKTHQTGRFLEDRLLLYSLLSFFICPPDAASIFKSRLWYPSFMRF